MTKPTFYKGVPIYSLPNGHFSVPDIVRIPDSPIVFVATSLTEAKERIDEKIKEAAGPFRALVEGPEKPSPTAPTVNINGTASSDLRDQQRSVHDAAYALHKALLEACPHGRDYQTAPEGDYERARGEHEDRCASAKTIMASAYEISAAIYGQGR